MQSLQHARLKTARALEHLDGFKLELERYYVSKSYAVTRADDAERGLHVIHIFMKDPGDKMAILTGEFAHALRYSLDHAVYSLIVFATEAILLGETTIQASRRCSRNQTEFGKRLSFRPLPLRKTRTGGLVPYHLQVVREGYPQASGTYLGGY